MVKGMNLRKNIIRILGYTLVLLFVSYYSNITFFYHSHLVNGNIITHSHWFKDFDNHTPVQSHGHSSEEYIYIHILENTAIDNDVFIPFYTAPNCLCIEIGFIDDTSCITKSFLAGFYLRGPPLC